jgi:hypothetical protein
VLPSSRSSTATCDFTPMAGHSPSATGVVFSTARLPEDDEKKAQVTATVEAINGEDSNKSSPAPSIKDPEKAEGTLEDDEKALANYVVPALAKGQKNARLKPPTYWTRFRVWYNPYRMVGVCFASSLWVDAE